jgi:hypothetical protein
MKPIPRRDALKVLGDPLPVVDRHGVVQVSDRWEARYMTVAEFEERPPGLWPGRVYCHRELQIRLEAALRNLCELDRAAQLGGFRLERLVCFSPRRTRFAGNEWSWHLFGAAIDVNSAQNPGRRFWLGRAPEPLSLSWRRIWPPGSLTVDWPAIEAFEAAGFVWGGRRRDAPEPGHFSIVAPD